MLSKAPVLRDQIEVNADLHSTQLITLVVILNQRETCSVLETTDHSHKQPSLAAYCCQAILFQPLL